MVARIRVMKTMVPSLVSLIDGTEGGEYKTSNEPVELG